MMRKVALVLGLSLAIAGSAFAVNPSLSAGGGGPHQQYDSGRPDVAWSEPPDLNGLIMSSEEIPDVGLQSEVANDFVLAYDNYVCVARWWGGYFHSSCGEVGYGTSWNLRFYDDGGCVPNNVIYETVGAYTNETSIGCQAGAFPMFEYEAVVSVPVIGGNLYWFGAQCSGHVFPPQVGRLAAMEVTNCESTFKSEFFAFPDWVSVIFLWGVSVDFSQEFQTWGCAIVPVVKTTWGAVKALYR